jgi:flagellar protein FliL
VADGEKGFPVVFIAIAGVVLLLLAGGVSYLISSHIAGTKSANTGKYYEPGILYKVGDAKDGLIVNVGGPNGSRYIKTSIVLELRPTKNARGFEGKGLNHDEVKMSDAVVRVLRAQKIEDFDASRQERLKELIKSEVNTTLGNDKVMHVYVTNFVLQ